MKHSHSLLIYYVVEKCCSRLAWHFAFLVFLYYLTHFKTYYVLLNLSEQQENCLPVKNINRIEAKAIPFFFCLPWNAFPDIGSVGRSDLGIGGLVPQHHSCGARRTQNQYGGKVGECCCKYMIAWEKGSTTETPMRHKMA